MDKKKIIQLAVGFVVVAGGAWFSSPASRGCTRLVVDATWKSNGESRWQRLEVEAGPGRSTKVAAIEEAVKDIDGNAAEISSRTIESGFCKQ
jgi:hypothetical protein